MFVFYFAFQLFQTLYEIWFLRKIQNLFRHNWIILSFPHINRNYFGRYKLQDRFNFYKILKKRYTAITGWVIFKLIRITKIKFKTILIFHQKNEFNLNLLERFKSSSCCITHVSKIKLGKDFNLLTAKWICTHKNVIFVYG